MHGLVRVTGGKTCVLENVKVFGDVETMEGSVLRTIGNTMVNGSVRSDGSTEVSFFGTSKIVGSVTAKTQALALNVGENATVGAVNAVGGGKTVINGTVHSLQIEGIGTSTRVTGTVMRALTARQCSGVFLSAVRGNVTVGAASAAVRVNAAGQCCRRTWWCRTARAN